MDSEEVFSDVLEPDEDVTVDTGISDPGNYHFEVHVDDTEAASSDISIDENFLEGGNKVILHIRSDETAIKWEV